VTDQCDDPPIFPNKKIELFRVVIGNTIQKITRQLKRQNTQKYDKKRPQLKKQKI